MFSCKICENFKKIYFEEHLPTDASINERQQETHAFSGKKNETYREGNKCFPKIAFNWIWLNYLTKVALFFNFISLDYESIHGGSIKR